MAVVGDSITVLARDELRSRLAAGPWRAQIRAVNGATTLDMEPAVEALVAGGPPDQAVVNLGTNDVMQGRSGAATVGTVGHLVELLAGAACIHLVTLNEGMLSFADPGLGARVRAVNAGLVRLAGHRPGAGLLVDVAPVPEGPFEHGPGHAAGQVAGDVEALTSWLTSKCRTPRRPWRGAAAPGSAPG